MPTPRVLIADDNPLSLRFLADALARAGCACVEAADGEAALRHALDARFDLLLLDACMPGLDGAAVLARVRAAAGPSRDACALATTAAADPETLAALHAAGFADVLAKPLGVGALHAAVRHHLEISAVARTSAGDLDEDQALRAAGGDAAIVAALRTLFVRELAALPAELAVIGGRADADALRERLHRLDASAGFCGSVALVQAAARLRAELAAPAWPHAALANLLAVSENVRRCLAG